MAYGFGTTFGVGATDVVSIAQYAAINNLDTLSIAIRTNRNGDGGGSLGRLIDKTGGISWFSIAAPSAYRFQALRWATTNGEWHVTRPAVGVQGDIVLTYDYGSVANDPLVWLDGTSQTVTETATPAGTPLDTETGAFLIGNRAAGDRAWNGVFADVALWNRVLTPAEAEAITGDKLTPLAFPQGLVLYVPLIRDLVNLCRGSTPTATGTAVTRHPSMRWVDADDLVPVPAAAGGGVVTRSPRFGVSSRQAWAA